ncbi:Uncharacterised protein [Mycobacterium tuberculosis]|nr:Uncharacterised protein [Mycobacterium tuberculosis]
MTKTISRASAIAPEWRKPLLMPGPVPAGPYRADDPRGPRGRAPASLRESRGPFTSIGPDQPLSPPGKPGKPGPVGVPPGWLGGGCGLSATKIVTASPGATVAPSPGCWS